MGTNSRLKKSAKRPNGRSTTAGGDHASAIGPSWARIARVNGKRNQLKRVRTRAKCPLCTSTELVYADPHELCLACGVSWIRDVRETPIAATPLPQTAA